MFGVDGSGASIASATMSLADEIQDCVRTFRPPIPAFVHNGRLDLLYHNDLASVADASISCASVVGPAESSN